MLARRGVLVLLSRVEGADEEAGHLSTGHRPTGTEPQRIDPTTSGDLGCVQRIDVLGMHAGGVHIGEPRRRGIRGLIAAGSRATATAATTAAARR